MFNNAANLVRAAALVNTNIWRRLSIRLYEEPDHADLYQKFRPKWSPGVAEKVVAFVKEKKTSPLHHAVDIGCGSGQSTVILAPHFHQVSGIDISKVQVAMATIDNKLSNVKYRTGSAEHIPFPDSSIDLVTCANACHYFDFPKFHQEVDRVLSPHGCLAVFGYWMSFLSYGDCSDELNRILFEFHYSFRDYWHERGRYLANQYRDIPLPYSETMRDDSMYVGADYSLPEFIGYLSSRSSYREYCRRHPNDKGVILQNLQHRLYEATKSTRPPEQVILRVVYPVFLVMSRKPQQ